jgi:hypothetical protein
MKTLLACFLALTLMSCNMPHGMGQPVVERDWSTFEQPAPGTPLVLRVYYYTGIRSFSVIHFPGTWGDNKPYRMSFPIWCDVPNVGRIEVIFEGEVIIARNFKPLIKLEKGKTAGWEKT